jgi:hypothetical protein
LTTQTVFGSVLLDRPIHALAFEDDVAAVPEPSTLAMFGLGGLGLAFSALRHRFRKAV